MEYPSQLITPDQRYRILRRSEGGIIEDHQRVIQSALRIVPGVEKLPSPVQRVLAQIYAIIPENPSDDVLNRALRWAFAHISHRRDMINLHEPGNQWEKVIRHYMGRNSHASDIGFYAEMVIAENILLHALTRLRGPMSYDVHLSDCLGDSDFMADWILTQQKGASVFRWGVQLTTQNGGIANKRKHLLERHLDDSGLYPRRDRELVPAFLRDHTMVIQLRDFSPSTTVQTLGLHALLGNDPSRMLQTGLIHRAEMNNRRSYETLFGHPAKNHRKAPSKEIGRQIFEILRFFHEGVMNHVITSRTKIEHHHFGVVNDRGERISGAVFLNEGVPTFEGKIREKPYTWKAKTGDKPQDIQHTPVSVTIPIPPRFIHRYLRFGMIS